MTVYKPDRWVVLRIESDGKQLHKVLGGWTGGYLDSDSWRINSGVTAIREDGDHIEFTGKSGSVYRVHKSMYGTTSLSGAALQTIEEVAAENGSQVEVLPKNTDWEKLL